MKFQLGDTVKTEDGSVGTIVNISEYNTYLVDFGASRKGFNNSDLKFIRHSEYGENKAKAYQNVKGLCNQISPTTYFKD